MRDPISRREWLMAMGAEPTGDALALTATRLVWAGGQESVAGRVNAEWGQCE